MFIKLLVLCSVLTFVYSKCHLENIEFANLIVTINEHDKPYWYQASFDECIDGEVLNDISTKRLTIHTDRNEYRKGEIEISNFPELQEVFLDNLNLKTIPHFYNLTDIVRIDLSYNRIERIDRNKFSNLSIKELFISRNNITEIEDGSFGKTLEVIQLSCNKLKVVKPSWFVSPNNLRILRLGGNQISVIPDNFLAGFSSLNRIDLRHNGLTSIGASAFSGPSNLKDVDLGYNNLTELKYNIFDKGGIEMTYFDIQFNKLSYLSDEFLSVVRVNSVKTWGNPWQCPCLPKINKWKLQASVLEPEDLPKPTDVSCVYSMKSNDSCVEEPEVGLYEKFMENFKFVPHRIICVR